MPRLVDHDERRADLAAAAIRIMLREGLDGVTVRGVAAEAGFSTGSLRHYFANQRELQEYVAQAATDLLRDAVLPRVQRPRTADSLVEGVAQVLEELLPLDAQRRDEYALWVAIAEWERRHPPDGGSRTWADQRALYRGCVAPLRGQPAEASYTPAPDPGVELWAAVIHTFIDGLAAQLVHTPGELPAETARRLLRALLGVIPHAG